MRKPIYSFNKSTQKKNFYKPPEKTSVEGTIKTVTFYDSESHFTVAKVYISSKETITITGEVPGIAVGSRYIFNGTWLVHKKFGTQLKVEGFVPKMPTTDGDLKKYLGSGLLKGVGPATAKQLVDHFGDSIFDVIETTPDRLQEIASIGIKKQEVICNGWKSQKGTKEIFIFLQSHNVSTGMAVRIYKAYGHNAISRIKKNPYRLADDLWGVGFKTADTIAKDMGLKEDSPERLQSGLLFMLQEAKKEGHCYLPQDELITRTAALLEQDADLLTTELQDLTQVGRIKNETDSIYLTALYHAEKETVAHIARLMNRPLLPGTKTPIQIGGITLAPEQEQAVKKSRSAKVMVLTGGPGTGKTTTLIAIARQVATDNRIVLLAAPTGRAAKRMTEATGQKAKTIHRLLEFNPATGGFKKDAENPLELDTLIIDEASMMDLPLFRDLLAALPDAAQLILVGDRDQLPSVGPGSVLNDLITSRAVTTVHLAKIFRQAEESLIVMNAHRINNGEMPDIANTKSQNFFFIECDDPDTLGPLVTDLASRRLTESYDMDPTRDIQVIAPMYKGGAGVNALNTLLQDAINPAGAELVKGFTRFRVGDKVMQLRNNYDKNIFNGDTGYITHIDKDLQEMTIWFNKSETYDFNELDEVTPAYAITVHKSQGSEYRAVILVLSTQHYMMLQRNLVYTAITRAKELLVLVGSKKALGLAVKNDKIRMRYTGLSERLQQL